MLFLNQLHSPGSDGTLMVWGLDNLPEHLDVTINLKSKAVVAAHGKKDSNHGKGDINSVAVSPDDAFVCSGSQVRDVQLCYCTIQNTRVQSIVDMVIWLDLGSYGLHMEPSKFG